MGHPVYISTYTDVLFIHVYKLSPRAPNGYRESAPGDRVSRAGDARFRFYTNVQRALLYNTSYTCVTQYFVQGKRRYAMVLDACSDFYCNRFFFSKLLSVQLTTISNTHNMFLSVRLNIIIEF